LQFHRGAASVAVRAATALTPVLISVNPSTLTKHVPWHRIPLRRPHFRLEVAPDVELGIYQAAVSQPMAGRALNEALLGHYRAALARAPDARVATP
jgi:hypothetical protein